MSANSNLSSDEYRLKVAYLYKFTKFINWPKGTFDTPDSPLNICIKGSMPDALTVEQLQEQSTRGHPLKILSVDQLDAISSCHVIYFRDVARMEARELLQEAGELPILTVGEYKSFARDDGIIEFKIAKDRRIQLIINQSRAKNLNIMISARLLEIASVLRKV